MPVLFRDITSPSSDAGYRLVRARTGDAPLMSADPLAWRDAPLLAWGPPRYRTVFRACWDEDALFVRYDVSDDGPWHTLTERDDRLWEEEVVELFLDPLRGGLDYAEVEISPANVVCDLRVRTPWPALDSDRHWHWEGLVSAVMRPAPVSDSNGDWIATARLPWSGLASLCDGIAPLLPPKAGDCWRFNVFRIKRPHGPAEPEREAVYAAWSVPDGPSFHAPEVFRDLLFEG